MIPTFAGRERPSANRALRACASRSRLRRNHYLQALGLEKEELVQALGLAFTVSTLALAVNLARAGAFTGTVGLTSLVALAAALAGLLAGQMLRQRLRPEAFRVWFLLGLLALGSYIALRALA